MRVARLIAIGVRGLLAGMALSACSATSSDKLTFFADPGAFDYHSCDQIAALRAHWSAREQELKQLMARSEQSTGGAVINVIAYQADYTQAQEQVRVLTAAARSKNCSTPENWRSNSSFR